MTTSTEVNRYCHVRYSEKLQEMLLEAQRQTTRSLVAQGIERFSKETGYACRLYVYELLISEVKQAPVEGKGTLAIKNRDRPISNLSRFP